MQDFSLRGFDENYDGHNGFLEQYDQKLENVLNDKNIILFNISSENSDYTDELFFIDKKKYSKHKIEYIEKMLIKIGEMRFGNKRVVENVEKSDCSQGFSKHNCIFGNYVDENNICKNPEELTSEERLELVSLLKEQNEFLLKHFNINNAYSLIYSLQIDLIFKLSEKNEMKYFDDIFKAQGFEFKDIIYFMIDCNAELENSRLSEKIISMYIDEYGDDEIYSIFDRYKENGCNFETKNINNEDFDNSTWSHHVSEDAILLMVKLASEKNPKFFKDENEKFIIINKEENEFTINTLRIKPSYNIKNEEIEKINNYVEEISESKFFYKKKTKSVYVKNKTTNIMDLIEKTYDALFEDLMDLNKRKLKDDELNSLIRKAYLQALMNNKEQKETKPKRKV